MGSRFWDSFFCADTGILDFGDYFVGIPANLGSLSGAPHTKYPMISCDLDPKFGEDLLGIVGAFKVERPP